MLVPVSSRPVVPVPYGGRIFGNQFPSSLFSITESFRTIPNDALARLLRGEAVAHIVRGYTSHAEAEALARAFEAINAGRLRLDGVAGLSVGSSHFKQTIDGYLNQAHLSIAEMLHLYNLAGINLEEMTDASMLAALSGEYTLRSAEHSGRKAPKSRAVAWADSGGFTLKAHDDLEQTRTPEQNGFEVQRVLSPVAGNFYARMPDKGGQLRMWNVLPSQQYKVLNGVQYTGYPYDESELAEFDFVDIVPNPGDLVFINGSFPHAVVSWDGQPTRRIVFNWFAGLLEFSNTVIRWT